MGFGLGSAVLLGALGWASVAVYRLEGRNVETRALSQRQEVIRRALWRVDSQMAPIIAMEAARPPSEPGQYLGGLGESAFSDQANLGLDQQQFLLINAYADGYFEVDPSGGVRATDERSEQVAAELAKPEAEEPVALAFYARESATSDTDEPPTEDETGAGGDYDYAARKQVADIATNNDYTAIEERSNRQRAASQAVADETPADGSESLGLIGASVPGDAAEPAAMSRSMGSAVGVPLRRGDAAVEPTVAPPVGRIDAVWVGPEDLESDADTPTDLVLLRVTETGQGARTEGVRLDWAVLRGTLEASVADLLPTTRIVPARGERALAMERAGDAYRLATIPALLVPGGAVALPDEQMTPAFWAMLATWIATLVALVAVASVLHATLRLSDRRARFVGAVTHELRTPLTTFRLYAQMLAGGMVTDEQARAEYLGTLERESVRLGEIVENVLEYARLTRRRPGDARPPGERCITPSELVARVRPVLSRRAEQSGMDLIVSIDASAEPGANRSATCDPRSVERILMNLVENACKYASPAPGAPGEPDADHDDGDTRIHLDVKASGRALEILVADHGPGVPPRQRERVFGEFQRGPGAAESSRPGLGLGLALSRGLAREMGGDLRVVRRRGHGAEFLLTIPLDAGPATPDH